MKRSHFTCDIPERLSLCRVRSLLCFPDVLRPMYHDRSARLWTGPRTMASGLRLPVARDIDE